MQGKNSKEFPYYNNMEISTLLLILLIAFAIYLIYKKQTQKNIKPEIVKKEEIIQSYKEQMKELINNHKDDNAKLLSEKTKLLKKINYELSMNLFFDEKESKELIQELLKIK